MKIDILTIFPGYFESPLKESITGRAITEGRCTVRAVDFRTFSQDKHGKVDDKPFGGGPGMVLTLQPVVDCLESIISEAKAEGRTPRLIITTCRGDRVDHLMVDGWLHSSDDGLIILCGHYEDFDVRLYDLFNFEEVSLGDFVLTGGEPVAMCIIDAIVRKLPGVVGNPASIKDDSFDCGMLDYPSYTRPVEYRGVKVPDVLMSGNHAKIKEWRQGEAERITRLKRPDLLRVKLDDGPPDDSG